MDVLSGYQYSAEYCAAVSLWWTCGVVLSLLSLVVLLIHSSQSILSSFSADLSSDVYVCVDLYHEDCLIRGESGSWTRERKLINS